MCAPVHRYGSPLLVINLFQVSHVGDQTRPDCLFQLFPQHSVGLRSSKATSEQSSVLFCTSLGCLSKTHDLFLRPSFLTFHRFMTTGARSIPDRIRVSSTFHRGYWCSFLQTLQFCICVICQKVLVLSHLSNRLCPRSFVAHRYAIWQILVWFSFNSGVVLSDRDGP